MTQEWAPDFGYDPDSRRALAIFEATTKQTDQLREFLGDDFDAAVFPPYDDANPYRDSSDIAAELTKEA